ncbi:methyltransferase domain-containing protein [Amycolatopsis suaedae]|uniref:Protein-L-isoaspartate O-methyltransferase n=1 Tax=Amycolatopsis suaedae TaxID=2510978 RepID=A0A4Q7JB75_9PSEU|nr:methyltransferase domain-containing protein [Amycolatopsis suaedae]RZQ64328.1 methyltransferase domain-containing protein [Amycolatopsis suaedae]
MRPRDGLDRQRRRLVAGLRRAGVLADPHWLSAFRAIPREPFVERFFLPHGWRWRAVDRTDPGWSDLVYADRVLVTQLDDDPHAWERARRDGPIAGTPTCSSSMPTIMAIMLEELLASAGQNVLEVGTGTGYNAALLSHRLDESNVSTVDIDGSLVESARAALAGIGLAPVCEVADGLRGFAARAPYDRVLCTCSVSAIPPEWLRQTRPGGLVVTTLNRPIGAGLVRVRSGGDGTGRGRVLPRDGRFMPLRAHRFGADDAVLARARAGGPRRRANLALRTVMDPASPFEFYAGLVLDGVLPHFPPDASGVTYLVHPDGSWVRHLLRDGSEFVEQGGPRQLWDAVERADGDWRALGRPLRDRFGITVTEEAQYLWLDAPDSPHRWPLGG